MLPYPFTLLLYVKLIPQFQPPTFNERVLRNTQSIKYLLIAIPLCTKPPLKKIRQKWVKARPIHCILFFRLMSI